MMKHFLLCAISLIGFSYLSFAQDIILTNDGEEIQALVQEISETQIKYKLFSNPDGPTRVLNVNSIFRIKYSDGSVELFTKKSEAASSSQTPDEETDKYSNSTWSFKPTGIWAGDIRLKNDQIRAGFSEQDYESYIKAYKAYDTFDWFLYGGIGGCLGLLIGDLIWLASELPENAFDTTSLILYGVCGTSILVGGIGCGINKSKINDVINNHNASVRKSLTIAPSLQSMPSHLVMAQGNNMSIGLTARLTF